MADVAGMIRHAAEGRPTDFAAAFRELVHARAVQAVVDRRAEVAKTLFRQDEDETVAEADANNRTGYNKDAVDDAIKNNRTGKIGKREASAIHALLKGRSRPKPKPKTEAVEAADEALLREAAAVPFENMSHEAQDIVLHADNTPHLYRQQDAFKKNMAGHMAKGKYDPEKGRKLWGYYADRVAQDYHKQHGAKGVPWHKAFTPKHRAEAAAHFEDYHRGETLYPNRDGK